MVSVGMNGNALKQYRASRLAWQLSYFNECQGYVVFLFFPLKLRCVNVGWLYLVFS